MVKEKVLGKGYESNTFYLHILATHPEHQGQGIGSALIRHVTKQVLFHMISVLTVRRMNRVVDVSWKHRNTTLMCRFTSILDLSWLRRLRCPTARILSR